MISDEQLEEWERLARATVLDHPDQPLILMAVRSAGPDTPNTGFFREARTAVPTLVAEVRRLRAYIDAARARFHRETGPEYTCRRHNEPSCPSCLAYAMGDLREGANGSALADAGHLRITSGRVRLPGEADEDEPTKA